MVFLAIFLSLFDDNHRQWNGHSPLTLELFFWLIRSICFFPLDMFHFKFKYFYYFYSQRKYWNCIDFFLFNNNRNHHHNTFQYLGFRYGEQWEKTAVFVIHLCLYKSAQIWKQKKKLYRFSFTFIYDENDVWNNLLLTRRRRHFLCQVHFSCLILLFVIFFLLIPVDLIWTDLSLNRS